MPSSSQTSKKAVIVMSDELIKRQTHQSKQSLNTAFNDIFGGFDIRKYELEQVRHKRRNEINQVDKSGHILVISEMKKAGCRFTPLSRKVFDDVVDLCRFRGHALGMDVKEKGWIPIVQILEELFFPQQQFIAKSALISTIAFHDLGGKLQLWFSNSPTPSDSSVRKKLINDNIDFGLPGRSQSEPSTSTDIDYVCFRKELHARHIDLDPENVTHIRATSGHCRGMGVEIGDLPDSSQEVKVCSVSDLKSHPKFVYHGTTMANFRSIVSDHCIKPGGLHEEGRSSVYLSLVCPKIQLETTTGRRVDPRTAQRQKEYEIVLVVDFMFFWLTGTSVFTPATVTLQLQTQYVLAIFHLCTITSAR